MYSGFLAFLALFFLVLAALQASKTVTLSRSQRFVGEVISLHAKDDRCSSDDRYDDCTKFAAGVRIVVDDEPARVVIDAGSAKGHGQPTSRAEYRLGDSVTVAFDPANPATAHSIQGVWNEISLLALFLLFSLLAIYRVWQSLWGK